MVVYTDIPDSRLAVGKPISEDLMRKFKYNDDFLYYYNNFDDLLSFESMVIYPPEGLYPERRHPVGWGFTSSNIEKITLGVDDTSHSHGGRCAEISFIDVPINSTATLQMAGFFFPCTNLLDIEVSFLVKTIWYAINSFRLRVYVDFLSRTFFTVSSFELFNRTTYPKTWKMFKRNIPPASIPEMARFLRVRFLIDILLDLSYSENIFYFDRVKINQWTPLMRW